MWSKRVQHPSGLRRLVSACVRVSTRVYLYVFVCGVHEAYACVCECMGVSVVYVRALCVIVYVGPIFVCARECVHV